MNKQILKNEIENKAKLIYQEGVKKFDLKNPVELNFDFSLRGRVAGYASREDGKLQYNLEMALKNYDSFLGDTVAHEVAHIIAFQKYPDSKPHGKEWKKIMLILGYEPHRCHNMTVTPARKTTKIYNLHCDCRSFKVTKKKHDRLIRTCYYCSRCKSNFESGKGIEIK
jgi:SprT protein